jgi:hypothetical protein
MLLGSVWSGDVGRLHSGKEVSKRRKLSKTMEEYWGGGEYQRDDEASKKWQLQPENREGGILPARHPSLVRKRIAVKGERCTCDHCKSAFRGGWFIAEITPTSR